MPPPRARRSRRRRRAGHHRPAGPEKPRLTLADIARVLEERNAAEAGAQEEQAEGGGEAERNSNKL
jgi:hypothetical protein